MQKITITMDEETGDFYVTEEAGELGSIASFPYRNEAAGHIREILRRWDDEWAADYSAKRQETRQVRIIHNGVPEIATIRKGYANVHSSGMLIDYDGTLLRPPLVGAVHFDINKDAYVIEDAPKVAHTCTFKEWQADQQDAMAHAADWAKSWKQGEWPEESAPVEAIEPGMVRNNDSAETFRAWQAEVQQAMSYAERRATLMDRAFAAQKEREAKEIEEIPPIVLGVDPNKKW